MAQMSDGLRVFLASDSFYPQSFRWGGRNIRVLFVESIRTTASERVFCLRTVEGSYELVQHAAQGNWSVRRQPSWWERALAQGASAARYAPAAGRGRRGRAARLARRSDGVRHSANEGGENASGFALVR